MVIAMVNLSKRRQDSARDDEKIPQRSRWRTMLGILAVAGAVGATSNCSSSSSPPGDGCYQFTNNDGGQGCYCVTDGSANIGTLTSQGCIPSNNDSGTCTPKTQCVPTTGSGLLNAENPNDSSLVVGNYTIRLDLTDMASGVQSATVEVLTNCGKLVQSSAIPTGGTFPFSDGNVQINVNIGNVTISSPRSAQVNVSISCSKDGGTMQQPDAGSSNDGGNPDSGSSMKDAGGQ